MNKRIELVKKWLANPESVTQKELVANYEAAKAVYVAGDDVYGAVNAYDAFYAAYDAAYGPDTYYAAWWVKRYEEVHK